MNWTALLDGAKTISSHPITKGGSLAAIISGGLYAASFAGVAIPGWAFTVGPILGYAAYRLLPAKDQALVDDTATKIEEIATEVPQTYSADKDFPAASNSNPAAGQPNSNINKQG